MDEWMKETMDETVDEKGQSADSTHINKLLRNKLSNVIRRFDVSNIILDNAI